MGPNEHWEAKWPSLQAAIAAMAEQYNEIFESMPFDEGAGSERHRWSKEELEQDWMDLQKGDGK